MTSRPENRRLFSSAAGACFAVWLLLAAGCAGGKITEKPIDVRFALIGNTSPDTPFIGFSEKLGPVIAKINEENPLAVIHLGNIIHGGTEWIGIREVDINRQFEAFRQEIEKLNAIFYSLPGENDLYNKSLQLYSSHLKRNLNYSFNYGNLHVVLFNTVNTYFETLKKRQLEWLAADLESHKRYAGVIIFTHHQVFPQAGNGPRFDDGERFHRLVSKYPVLAVISGDAAQYSEKVRDGIRYIVAGCGGYTREKLSWYFNQYYILELRNGEVAVRGKKLQ